MSGTGYRVEPGNAVLDGEQVVAVWRGNLGRHDRLAAKYDWFYRRCPWGAPLLRFLRHEPTDAIVGVAAAGLRQMRLAGRNVHAGVLVDMAVGAEHRSLFPALLLQKQLMTDGLKQFDVLYGFPNPKAAAVFKRVGYTPLAKIVRYAAVVRSGHYLARRMPAPLAAVAGLAADALLGLRRWLSRFGKPRVLAAWTEQADVRMDALSTASATSSTLHAVRDRAFLAWRFDQSADRQCRYLCLTESGTASLLAWFACQADERLLHVRDFWTVDGDANLQHTYLSVLQSAARAAGYASVSLEFLGNDAIVQSLRATGFAPRGSRPVYCALSPSLIAAGGVARFHLTSADEDE